MIEEFDQSQDTPVIKNRAVYIIENGVDLQDAYIAVKIEEQGSFYAGLFNQNGNIHGRGVFINRKGIVYKGNFDDNCLEEGKVIQKNGNCYEGKLVDFKKHADQGVETKTGKYRFVGKFEKGKRVSGVLTLLNHPYIKEMIIEKYDDMKTEYNTKILYKNTTLDYIYTEKTRNEYETTKDCPDVFDYLYQGKVSNKKMNDENAIIKVVKEGEEGMSGVFEYSGSVKNNIKEGLGKYFWNNIDHYEGHFKNNKPHSVMNKHEKVIFEGKEFKVLFDKGFLLDKKAKEL